MPEEKVWTVRDVLEWTEGYLASKGDGNALGSARWIISDALGISRIEIYMDLDRPLTMPERDKIRDGVRRRAAGEPLQYITGKAPFRYLDILVKPNTLIPRPETEVLVSSLISELDLEDGRQKLILDICTGTGCIACALATELDCVKVIATDISEDAIELARQNVEKNQVSDKIELIEGNLADNVDHSHLGHIDAIISNPPYVPTSVLESLPSEVRDHEPRIALDGGEDGLCYFRQILDYSIDALSPDGILAVELFEDALEEAKRLALDKGFAEAAITNDLNDLPRVLLCRKKERASNADRTDE